MKDKEIVISHSAKETEKFGEEFGKTLKSGDIVLLSGDLGAGKTVFTKGFVRGRGIKNAEVVSPTFTIMNEYGNGEVFHFDLYRLDSLDEFISTGAEEWLYSDAVSIVEWPEIVGKEFFPETVFVVEIRKKDDSTREIVVTRNV